MKKARRYPKNALIVSFHDWKSKRYAGFHNIGRALLDVGCDVAFLSNDRPVFKAFGRRHGVHTPRNWSALMRGIEYPAASAKLTNFTYLNLRLPGPIARRVGGWINRQLKCISDWQLAKKVRRCCPEPDFIIIESGGSVFSYPILKRVYPERPFVYRPSDPCIGSISPTPALIQIERRLVKEAAAVLLVNPEGQALYGREGYELSDDRTFILPNGIDLDAFRRPHPCPRALRNKPSVCYVGGHPPYWDAILALADANNGVNVVVVCPESLPAVTRKEVSLRENIIYIEGITPDDVPAYIFNANVVMIPYMPGWGDRPLGMHGKVMQAICAKKPIVAMHMDKSLREEGVFVEDTISGFVHRVLSLLDAGCISYAYDLSDRSWEKFRDRFIEIVNSIGPSTSLAQSPSTEMGR